MPTEITNEIWRAVTDLFVVGVAAFAFIQAKGAGENRGLWRGHLVAFGWCLGIALFAALTMGRSSCDEPGDPIYGGCEAYADDGYNPTAAQRGGRFAYTFLMLIIPAALGVAEGTKRFKSRRDATPS